jgi:hypothetical protein
MHRARILDYWTKTRDIREESNTDRILQGRDHSAENWSRVIKAGTKTTGYERYSMERVRSHNAAHRDQEHITSENSTNGIV